LLRYQRVIWFSGSAVRTVCASNGGLDLSRQAGNAGSSRTSFETARRSALVRHTPGSFIAVNSDDFVTVLTCNAVYVPLLRLRKRVPQTTFDYAGKDADDRGNPTTGIGEGGAAEQIPSNT
jgi:hypothetical protein